jgi:hypothetical protein
MQTRARFRPVASVVGLLALTGVSMVGGATPADAAGILDTQPYDTCPIPAWPALPGVGNTYTDSTFGTEVMQITGPNSAHAYAYWPTFNKNSTMLYVFREKNDAGPAFYDFDPVNFALGPRTDEPLFEQTCTPEDAMWSGVNPDIIHCGDGTAAFMAGSSPASAPMTRVAPMPPAQVRVGMTISQCLLVAGVLLSVGSTT